MSKFRETVIYSLSDPSTGDVRYVGKTCARLTTRIAGHRAKAKYSQAPVCRWVAKLHAAGLSPVGTVLEVIAPGGDWQSREIFWIAEMKAKWGALLNVSLGGAGSPADRKDTEETLRRKKESQRRVRENPEFHEKVKAGLIRHWSDPEARAAHSAKLTQIYADADLRGRCGVPKGTPKSPEWAAAAAAGKRASGYSPSAETRRKIAETLKSRGDPWAKARAAKAAKAGQADA